MPFFSGTKKLNAYDVVELFCLQEGKLTVVFGGVFATALLA
ncbi:hypothetical protein [Cerasicoccus arenae]|nr:hypothetical protein [Cerasicoccus arenae]